MRELRSVCGACLRGSGRDFGTDDQQKEDAAPEASRGTLARDRTDFAEGRTLLAHERSFASWVRTGMAAVGIGIGFNAFFQTLQPAWVPKAIASLFLLIACAIFMSAEHRARRAVGRLDAHKVATLAPVKIRLMTGALTAATIALAVAIWILA